MVEKALKRLNVDGVKLDDLASDFKFDKVDDFLAAVGYGDINPDEIGRHVLSGAEEQRRDDAAALPQFARPATPMGGLRVLGVGDLLTRVCRSCNPVPGDNIIGYITRGRGVTVHRVDCSSVLNEDEKDRLVSVDWSESGSARVSRSRCGSKPGTAKAWCATSPPSWPTRRSTSPR